MSEGGDYSNVGYVRTHPKAAVERPGYVVASGPSTRLMQTLFIAAFSGVVCAMIGSIWGFGLAGFIGGAMSGFAARTAWMLFSETALPMRDEYSDGRFRTEDEVRQALAEIEARKK